MMVFANKFDVQPHLLLNYENIINLHAFTTVTPVQNTYRLC